jgi:hypothetical protein
MEDDLHTVDLGLGEGDGSVYALSWAPEPGKGFAERLWIALSHDWRENEWGVHLGHGFDRVVRVHLAVLVIWAYFELAANDDSESWIVFTAFMLFVSIVVVSIGACVVVHFMYIVFYAYAYGFVVARYHLYKQYGSTEVAPRSQFTTIPAPRIVDPSNDDDCQCAVNVKRSPPRTDVTERSSLDMQRDSMDARVESDEIEGAFEDAMLAVQVDIGCLVTAIEGEETVSTSDLVMDDADV